jgi:hypothetical protein
MSAQPVRAPDVDELEGCFLPEDLAQSSRRREVGTDWIAEFAPETPIIETVPFSYQPAVGSAPAPPHRSRARVMTLAAATLAVAAITAVTLLLVGRPATRAAGAASAVASVEPPATERATAAPTQPAAEAPSAPAAATDSAPPPAGDLASPSIATTPEPVAERNRGTTSAAELKPPADRPETPVPAVRSTMASVGAAAPTPASPPEIPAAPTGTTGTTTVPVGKLDTLPLESVAPVTPKPPPPRSEPAPAPRPEAVAPIDSVRTTLGHFATAYSSLDAEAAQRVWPGVNRAALARAFQDLSRQEVTLGDCRIDVASDTAHASCRGSIDWTPKVGGGRPKTEARTWDFTLRKSADGWQIASARIAK